MEEVASHKDELYPHLHHVMSQHCPKTGSQEPKKHQKISETATLPTIPDEHHQEHPEPNKDAETESELEDDTVSSFKTKTLKNNFTEFFFL